MLDIHSECSIIVEFMKKTFKHRITTPAEPSQSELWNTWASNAWRLTATDCSERGLSTISTVRDWLYGIGIQPDRYIVRKGLNHGYDRRPICQIEIRFGYSEDLAWCRMSGI